MKIHTTMPERLTPFFIKELEIAGKYFKEQHFPMNQRVLIWVGLTKYMGTLKMIPA